MTSLSTLLQFNISHLLSNRKTAKALDAKAFYFQIKAVQHPLNINEIKRMGTCDLT